jgi:endoglucanase
MVQTRWRLRLLAAATAGLLAAGGATVPATAALAATVGCRANYTVLQQFNGGFFAQLTITNLGDQINGWTVTWTFPSGQRLTHLIGSRASQSGAEVTGTNLNWNAAIPTNGTLLLNVLGTWSGVNTAPTSFTLNGVACTGNVSETASAP